MVCVIGTGDSVWEQIRLEVTKMLARSVAKVCALYWAALIVYIDTMPVAHLDE